MSHGTSHDIQGKRREQLSSMEQRASVVFVLFLSLFLDLSSSQNYVLNDKDGLGRVFDGIGGLSGGGVSLSPITSWYDTSHRRT